MAEVPGEVVWSHGEGTMWVNIFWKANEALVSGRTYRVLDLPSYAERTQEFTVLPAVTWVKTAGLDVRSSLELTTGGFGLQRPRRTDGRFSAAAPGGARSGSGPEAQGAMRSCAQRLRELLSAASARSRQLSSAARSSSHSFVLLVTSAPEHVKPSAAVQS